MRQIKFRGKNENDEWMYGSLLIMGCNKFIMPSHDVPLIQYHKYLAYDNTIGQFTGLYDVNNDEIYEGDIVASDMFGSKYKYIVQWDNQKGCFIFKSTTKDVLGFMYAQDLFCMVKLGNIYDNKELLGL